MKHKVVYNNTYGNLSLSDEAIDWLNNNARQELADFIKERQNYYHTNSSNSWLKSLTNECSFISDAILDNFQRNGIKRHDEDLVRCVEALGERVNGNKFSDIRVAEIESNQYLIENYDGKETVREPKDLNFITIV